MILDTKTTIEKQKTLEEFIPHGELNCSSLINNTECRISKLLDSNNTEQQKMSFFHGTRTGDDFSTLISFIENGIDSRKAEGNGQGQGFYVFSDKTKAESYSMTDGVNQVRENSVLDGHSMVIEIYEKLISENFDLDCELNRADTSKFISENIDLIRESKSIISTKEYLIDLSKLRNGTSSDQKSIVITFSSNNGNSWRTKGCCYEIGGTPFEGADISQGEMISGILKHISSEKPELFHKS